MRFSAITIGMVLLCMAQSLEKVVPFAEFLRSVKHAQATEFMQRPGSEVKRVAAFEQMRTYILTLYEGMHVQRSYLVGTQTVDCIPVNEQPALRAQQSKGIALPPPGAVTPPAAAEKSPPARGCDAGTIPMRRITLEELTHFRTISDFLQKAPHGRAPVPPPSKQP